MSATGQNLASEQSYNWSEPDLSAVLENYGKKFLDVLFLFDSESLAEAKGFVDTYCSTEIISIPGKHHLNLLKEGDVKEAALSLMESNSVFYRFLRGMLELKSHASELLWRQDYSLELKKFAKCVEFLQRTPLAISETIARTSLLELMFWKSAAPSEEVVELGKLELPVLAGAECSQAMSELLVWIFEPSPVREIPKAILNAFAFVNAKLAETSSCLTSTQFATKWLQLHIGYYLRINIVQLRIGRVILQSKYSKEFESLDLSEITDRFAVLVRVAAILGYKPTPEFFDYVTETGTSSYIRYNHFGTLDIVFDKANVSEYNWPIKMQGISSRLDIEESAELLQSILEDIKSSELAGRIGELMQKPHSEAESEIEFPTRSAETVLEEKPRSLNEIEGEIIFNVTEPDGWELDDIPSIS